MPSEDIGYRETIQQVAIGDRKYVRFFDGRGHFAHLRLQVTPRPGEYCVVTKSDGLEIPESCYNAARASTFRRMECGPIQHYPMFGMEVQMVGGTYLPKYSHPQAFGFAAEMAFDEAVVHAGLLVMEPWIGLTLSVEPDALSEMLAILTRFVGDVPATISFTRHFVIQGQVPVRLLARIGQALRLAKLRTFPLPKGQQYRLSTDVIVPDAPPGDPLADWT
jgi:translation elongation factor EF-G